MKRFCIERIINSLIHFACRSCWFMTGLRMECEGKLSALSSSDTLSLALSLLGLYSLRWDIKQLAPNSLMKSLCWRQRCRFYRYQYQPFLSFQRIPCISCRMQVPYVTSDSVHTIQVQYAAFCICPRYENSFTFCWSAMLWLPSGNCQYTSTVISPFRQQIVQI